MIFVGLEIASISVKYVFRDVIGIWVVHKFAKTMFIQDFFSIFFGFFVPFTFIVAKDMDYFIQIY